MSTPNTASNRELYFRLLGYVKPYWKAFALAVLGMVATAATEPVFPALMKHLLDSGFQTQDKRLVWAIPLGIVVLFVVRSIFVFITGYLMMWISSRVVTDLRRAMFDKVLRLPSQHFETNSGGQLISRLVFDVSQVSEAGTSALITLVRESMTTLALFSYLLYLDWQLTLITVAIAPVIGVSVRAFSQRMRTASHKSMVAMRSISHTIEETVSAQKVIKVFGGQAQQSRRFHAATEEFRRAQMREAIPASATTPITHIAASLAIAVIAYLALDQSTGHGTNTAGGFVSFITAMLLLIAPLKQLTTINNTLQKGLAATESIFQLLDTPPENDHGKYSISRVHGHLVFQDVCFTYPGSERTALDHINFDIKPGQTVALVGASGGGKSTIGSLLPRFHTPTKGQILLDGTNTQDFTLESLRQNIALVSQDVVLFNDTLAANIAFGSTSKNRQEVIDAAKAANAWDFIEALPHGLDTYIGENGAKLSGGQRQRIAIARALLKNAPILILDEATSALDTESERQVQAALANLMKNRTTLVIAHRLSTIEHANQILVLDQGCIVERGTHQELLSAGGYYANLNKMQS